MKKIILIAILILSTESIYPQSNILFSDNFDDNRNNWETLPKSKKDNNSCLISDGKFKITLNKMINFSQIIPIDHRKDFSIELKFSFSREEKSDLIGLFSQNTPYNNKDITAFIVHSYNLARVIGFKDTVENEYKKYTRLSEKKLPSPSLLKVEVKNNKTSVYINDELFYSSDEILFPGNEIGFTVKGENIQIDYFNVYQENTGINLPEKLNLEFKKKEMNKNVNSVKDGINLCISPDGKILYMNARMKEDKKNPELFACDGIFYSEKQKDGEWGEVKKMTLPPTIFFTDIINISPDNNTLLMGDTSCRPSNDISFYRSYRSKDGWSKPQKIIIQGSYTKSVLYTCVISPDEKKLIISFRMDDTRGSSDMYLCSRVNDSTWSNPINIGSTLNSLGMDEPSFIAADNRTFYFVSDGRIGYGDMDIYVTRRLDDTWMNWSEPENIGPNINTKGWDSYYVMDAKGEYAYFNSDQNTGEPKFYIIKIPKEIKPSPVVMVKGRVLNSKDNKPLLALIYYEILSDGKEVGTARSNPSTGEYKIILPYGKQYGYRAEAKGFITVNENFDLAEEKDYIEIEKDLFLVPIEAGQTIKLNNVFFVQSKAELLPSSYPELGRLNKILKDNPHLEIELRGYTDNLGDPEKNIKLSEDRVKVVRDYLISLGIEESRIKGKGFGGANPVAKNDKEDTRKLNRRVEFLIIKN
jgi:outer membrane protein OmpA-like peptidoglycan-associated protein